MRLLAIETSGAACSVALLEGGEAVAQRHERIGRGHAEQLVISIKALPQGGRADAICVGTGPGSFTGVRVGIAAARGLALGWGVPVTGAPSLAVIAVQAGGAPVSIAIEGGHGEWFVQDFAMGLPTTELASLPPEAAAQAAKQSCVLGSAARRLVDLRRWGEARDTDAFATDMWRVPECLLASPPAPIYGRAADARPMGRPA